MNLTPLLTNAADIRKKIHEKTINAVQSAFPVDLKNRTLELQNLRVIPRDFSPVAQKKALMSGGTLNEPMKGTLVLKDKDGNVLDTHHDFTLLHVPYFTDRHTIIMDGNEYQVANMLRRKPGVYTERSENGELSTYYNLSKGRNFSILMNPEKGALYLNYGTSNIPLVPILRAIGVPQSDIARHLGPGVFAQNEQLYGHKLEESVNKLYEKLYMPGSPRANSLDGKISFIKSRYENTAMNPEVSQSTLGMPHAKVTPGALMDGARRLLDTYQGKKEPDDSDSLEFKTFHAVDDFLGERIRLAARAWQNKARFSLQGKDVIRGNLHVAPFTDSVRKFVTTSPLTAVPTGINPIELIDHAVKITALGEGGIPSERAIPHEARMTHPTHYGSIDPIRSPECHTENTEVYTEKGWKFWEEITSEDKLACRINGILEFHKPIRLIVEKYEGPVYGVNTRKLEWEVTPNHNMLSATLNSLYPLMDSRVATKLDTWRLNRADELHKKPRAYDTAHSAFIGQTRELFKIPDVEYKFKHHNINKVDSVCMKDWASFMGWYLSEGNCDATSTTISQSIDVNPKKCELIKSLLNRMGYRWTYESHGFNIHSKQLAAYLLQFGYCYDKFIPEHFFSESIEVRKSLLESLLLGDGRTHKIDRRTRSINPQQIFCTTSTKLAYDVERLAISLGYPVCVRKYQDNREERYLDTYEVRLYRQRYRQAKNKDYYTRNYSGMVYCAEVPGHLLYTRKNGKIPIWSGNSGHAGVDVRASIAAHRDDQGNLYTVVQNTRTKEPEYIKSGDILKHTIAFPHQELKGEIDVMKNGVVQKANAHEAQYQFLHEAHSLSPATSLIPMLHNIQGNRAIMGSKMQTQGLPLLEREAPLIQVKSHLPDGRSFERIYGQMVNPISPVNGIIHKIEDGYIYIRPDKAEKTAAEDLVKVPYQENFPFPSKTYLHHDLHVQPGQRVSAGQDLGESNYTRNGVLALGKNLTVAYVPYYGKNSNDAIVISEGAAKKLTSEHMYREVFSFNYGTETNKAKHRAYFGNKYPYSVYGKLDEQGIIRKGARVDYHDILVAGLAKVEIKGTDALLGKISKALTTPYKDIALTWTHETPGEVVDVVTTPTQITILVRTHERMQVGDKLCYDEKTEILTENGWCYFSELATNTKVATLQNGYLQYHYPSAYHIYPIGEKMYQVQSQQVDLLVTQSHNMWVRLQDKPEFSLQPALSLYKKRVEYQKHANWQGKSPDFIEFPALKVKAGRSGNGYRKLAAFRMPLSTYAFLLGAFLSEGNCVDCPKSGSYGIDITQIKEPNRSQLLKQLTDCGLKFGIHSNGTKIRIYSKQLLKHFKDLGYSYQKRIPNFVFSWSKNDLLTLFNWLMWGDGHKKKHPISYTTTSKQLADDIQRLLLLIGYAGNITERHTPIQQIKGKSYKCRKRYDVRIVATKLTPSINPKNKKQDQLIFDYEKPVYGVCVPGGVVYVRRNGKPVWSGNSGRWGNKGVVSEIIPDHKMIQDESGKPIDVLLTSAGVVSRINPAQVIETSVGKVALKTGKPIIFDNGANVNAVEWAKNLLKEHNVKDKEFLFDPVSGRTLKGSDGKGVLVGPQFIFKLFKTTDTNFSGHSVGPYDLNQQPLKVGGDESAKSIGKMELDALISHNARGLMREASVIKGQKNDEFWKAIQIGMPPPTLKPSFAYQKFQAMLESAGVKINKRDNKLKLLPLTDQDILNQSGGEILNGKTLIAKNLKPEMDGLFDVNRTGGVNGTRFSHISLPEPVPNPVFAEPIRRLLDLTQKEYDQRLHDHGGQWFKNQLSTINISQKITELKERSKRVSGTVLNDIIKQIKYLEALQKANLRPETAYVISHIPVIPPVYRPLISRPNNPNELMVSDANKLYSHLLDTKQILKDTVLPSDLGKHRLAVYNAVGSVFGTHETEDEELRGQSVKGFLTTIAGRGSPKGGFFQRKLLNKTQDVSGRGTIIPDVNLNMDEVGIPEQMLWQMFEELLVGRLVRQGYGPLDAKRLVTERAPVAKQALMQEIKERPVFINRAPTLHRFSIIGAKAIPVKGKSIRINPFMEKGTNSDFDGDTMQIHAPVTEQGIKDTYNMMLPNALLSDQSRNRLIAFPQHEAIIGTTLAAKAVSSTNPVKVFNSHEDLLQAYRTGQINLNDTVEVKNTKVAEINNSISYEGNVLDDYPPSLIVGDVDESRGTSSN